MIKVVHHGTPGGRSQTFANLYSNCSNSNYSMSDCRTHSSELWPDRAEVVHNHRAALASCSWPAGPLEVKYGR